MEPVPYDAESGFAKGSPGAMKHSASHTSLGSASGRTLHAKASLSKRFLSRGMPVTFKVRALCCNGLGKGTCPLRAPLAGTPPLLFTCRALLMPLPPLPPCPHTRTSSTL